ncbi:MAG: hypothetical protein J0H54_08600 [Rhizobiales bacterium]|nr:hypothetical protein [Hyphomicrobiales bacterium]
MSFPIGSGLTVSMRRLAAIALLLAGTAAPAGAQAAGGTIALELNDAGANAGACRLSFVIANSQKAAIDDMALELVLFDPDGRVERFVVVRSGKVPAGRSRVRQFDIPATSCDGIARVLINDVKECAGEGLTPAACGDRIEVGSRTKIRLDN